MSESRQDKKDREIKKEGSIKKIVDDLLNIEVNTIIKSNMSGRKMPGFKKAVEEIRANYVKKLYALCNKTEPLLNENSNFKEIKESAINEIEALEQLSASDNKDLNLLKRIRDMSGELEKIEGNHDMTKDQLLLIRKIWDIGGEDIVMQTVIQMDGDVITRVNEKYATNDWALLHEIHSKSVDKSLKFWKSILDAFTSIAKGFLGKYF